MPLLIRTPLLVLFALALAVLPAPAQAADEIDYNRDVRQILSNNCYACHGPDAGKRQAGLRLDKQEAAVAPLESDGFAIVPGDSAASKLIARITSTDDELVMPPPDAGKRLKPEEIAKLRAWIDQGAKWKGHWSYLKVERPALPAVSDPTWPKTPIDNFIMQRLDRDGLKPSPEASKASLIRRLSFDLTGLPPSIAEVDAFVADASPALTRNWSIDCWPRRAMASGWLSAGSTWPAMPTPTAITSTTTATCGAIANG